MELVYLWVEDFKNIKKQGFNFSPRFECKFYDKYDENGKLKDNCKLEIKPKKYIENFFGDNINVTAIVGKNGSGKSSVLSKIFLVDKSDIKIEYNSDLKYILLFNDKSNNKSINTNIDNLETNFISNKTPYIEYKDNQGFIKDYIKLIKDYQLYDIENRKINLETYNYIPTQVKISKKNKSKALNSKDTDNKFININNIVIKNLLDISLDDYDIDFKNKECVSFERLSTGEKKWSYMFLKSYYDINTSTSDTIIYGFDEPDIFLHPDWQKRFISDLLKVFKKVNKNIHFILTSHSPFLLSDIPKQNIIFLDKDEKGNCKVVDGLKEKKQTFGANIHTLLSDSFFMEDGLTGEFAKGKIDEAIKLLNQDKLDEKELKYCEQIISIIGEPIVKNQLQRMLDSKRLSKIYAISQKIKDMSYELEILKEHQSKIVQDELRDKGKKQYKQRFEDD